MSIPLKSVALALAAFAALPAIALAHPVQQVQPPMLQQVARSTVPSQIVPILFDPADPATASLMGGMPLTTVFALTAPQRSQFSDRYLALVANTVTAQSESHVTAQILAGRQALAQSDHGTSHQGAWLAQSESHVAAPDEYGQQASAQPNQNVIPQGTWLAAYHPGK
jgi:hypothetical protein